METKQNFTSLEEEKIFSDYLPALLKCIVMITLGYISGRSKLFCQSDTEGMNKFVTYWILPSLLYLTIATNDLAVIRWKMIFAILVTKTIIYAGVMFFCIIWNSRRKLVMTGIYSMLCTVTNDAALGNVIVQALYGKIHPDLPVHLFVIQPISMLLFQSITLTVTKTSHVDNCFKKQFFLNGVKSIWITSKNPLVLAMLAGLITSVWIPKPLPYYVIYVLNVIVSALPANVLFLLGMSMVGKFRLILKTEDHSIIIVCYFLKMIFTPIMLRLITKNVFYITSKDADFSFVYGVMAPYNGILTFARDSGISLNSIHIILTLSALSFFPFSYVTAVATINDLAKFGGSLIGVFFYYNIVNLIFGILFCVFNFKRKSKTCRIIIWFVISQMILSLGNAVTNGYEFEIPEVYKTISFVGQVMCHFWTANLAAKLYLKVNKQRYFLLIGFGIPLSLTTSILIYNLIKYADDIQFNFKYNEMMVGTTFIVISCCLVVVITFLSLYIRHKNSTDESVNENIPTLYSIPVDRFSSTDHLTQSTQNICRENVHGTVQNYSEDDDTLFRFLVMLSVLTALMLFLQLFKLTGNNKDGVFIIVKFLADVSNCGQGLLAFLWFEFSLRNFFITVKNRCIGCILK